LRVERLHKRDVVEFRRRVQSVVVRRQCESGIDRRVHCDRDLADLSPGLAVGRNGAGQHVPLADQPDPAWRRDEQAKLVVRKIAGRAAILQVCPVSWREQHIGMRRVGIE
jgi:hypothetical protein